MTKQEIINDIKNQTFCNRLVGGCQKVGGESGINVYQQSYLEVADNIGIVKSVQFYVLDEGTDVTETAYYIQGQSPTSTLNQTK